MRSAIVQRCLLEALEPREMMAGSPPSTESTMKFAAAKRKGPRAFTALEILGPKRARVTPHNGSPPGNAFTPQQLREAYDMNNVMFGNIAGDGSGQTIAIIVAYSYPTAFADLQVFNAQFGLPDPPSFRRVDQFGGTNYPAQHDATYNPTYGWQLEAALDIQWAHAMAPGADIVLVESNSPFMNDLIQAGVNWARQQEYVSVVSMSFGANEFSSETEFDQYFTTPGGHRGVTFVASTGDTGQPGGYPAFSPNVVGVGGTSLTLDNGEYLSESGWGGSGGGISLWQSKPSYQAGVTYSSNKRTLPDISLVGDPGTGAAVYSTFHQPGWLTVGGTSLAAPLFSGMMAVVNQGRTVLGLDTLDGRTGTLPMLYSAGTENFHDVVTGNNGFAAGPGYDLVTGLGSPIGGVLVNTLVGPSGTVHGNVYSDNNGDSVFNTGDTPLSDVVVYVDINNNGVFDAGSTQTVSYTSGAMTIPDNSPAGVTSPLTVANLPSTIVNLSLTLSITHMRAMQLTATLIGPDGTQALLFDDVGGMYGQNFNNTVFTDAAGTPISSGFAPFNGSYQPASPFAAFNGKAATGQWKLVVKDQISGREGWLNSWSLSITTLTETHTLSGTDGSYTLGPVAAGTYNIRTVTPQGFVDTTIPQAAYNVFGRVVAGDFTKMPTAFTSGPSEVLYLWQAGASLNISRGGTADNPAYQLPTAKVSSLRFLLTTPGAKLVVDYASGDVVPALGILVDGGGSATSELRIIGGTQPLNFSDTTVAEIDGPAITYVTLGGITFYNSTVNFNGTLQNLSFLNLEGATQFYWGGV